MRPWGGKRSNAGRPKRIPDGVKRRKQTIEVSEEQALELERVGDGNLTEGVRRLAQQSIERRESE